MFISCLQSIFCKLDWQEKKYGLCVGEAHLTNLRFADDIVLIAKSTGEPQQMMNDLTRESSRVGLNVNKAKTKIMSKTPASININNQPLGNVTNYPYLGNLVSVDGDHEPEVARRIGLAWNNFKKLDKYLIQPKFPLSLKKKIFMQCIVPTMTYASETWIITKKLESKIRSAQLQMERKMLGVRWKE